MNRATNRELELAFTRHYEARLARAGAITPGQKLALLDDLERELTEQGRVPLPGGPVRVDVRHPIVRAALEGRSVVMGGKKVSAPAASPSERLQALPVGGKVAVLVALFLLPLLLFGLVAARRGREETAVVVPPTLTPTPTVTVSPSPSPAPGTPVPTLPAPTATPYALALTGGEAPPTGNDPASVEIAGFSYVLGVGQVVNGEWRPQAAEWLVETDLHRVIAVPWEPDLAGTVSALRAGNMLTLRLRSGELVKYRITEVARVQRQQIEVLAGRSPGLSVVLYGEPSDQRTVILARAEQTPSDFTGTTAGAPLPSLPTEHPPAVTPLPASHTVQVTDTLTVSHPSGLALEVGACDRVTRVREQRAPEGQQYLVCEVTLRNTGVDTLRFTDQSLALTEREWVESRADWLPAVNVSVTDALGAGTLSPGSTTRGRIVGLVRRPGGGINGAASAPVLLWLRDSTRYVIALDD